jgi:hypothetical protein
MKIPLRLYPSTPLVLGNLLQRTGLARELWVGRLCVSIDQETRAALRRGAQLSQKAGGAITQAAFVRHAIQIVAKALEEQETQHAHEAQNGAQQ